jgi:hypothetical protein
VVARSLVERKARLIEQAGDTALHPTARRSRLRELAVVASILRKLRLRNRESNDGPAKLPAASPPRRATTASRGKHYATAPSAWSPYLMNGDASGLDDVDRQWCDQWIKSVGLGLPITSENAGFCKRHDAFAYYPLAAECRRYTFMVCPESAAP